jgi:glycosyltransferase involved in cell wall biosynthesis
VSVSVVVNTYEWPEALDAVLWSLSEQSAPDVDVVVADDGSGPATAAIVERWRDAFEERLRHVRQEDEGFRAARVRNLGALAAQGDYLVFVDGDSVPRRGFVRALRRCAVPGWFVGGKRLMLSRPFTERVLAERLPVHRWSLAGWLVRARGEVDPAFNQGLRALTPRDRRLVGRDGLPEFVPHAKGWTIELGLSRTDLERVNGFDNRFVDWGHEDHEIAARLHRIGLRCGWAGPATTLVHLAHVHRKAAADLRGPRALLRETEESDRVEAVHGLRELREELGS